MRLLLVGALSWNPERVRSLAERGHVLWGLWTRSMGWDQGPYPALEDVVRPVALEDAARTIREQRIDCVYSLFQAYDARLWAPPSPGVEHGVWSVLRTLLAERARGAVDVPIVRHWGFDVQNLDPDVARALDGHVFCNREKLVYWKTPRSRGGCGLDLFDRCEAIDFLDGDRPKREFMNDRFAEPLSSRGDEIHTVCIGRPFGVDVLAAARRGIHVHVYGNGFDQVYRSIADDLAPRDARRHAALLGRYLHVHPSLQTRGAAWPELRAVKARWVEEFSRYDAGWSYVGSPLPWPELDDRAAIPNRVSTYVLAGLPVISDRRPGAHRWEELRRLGIGVDLVRGDYDALRADLEHEVRTRAKRDAARAARAGYSFDASIEPLLGALERASAAYHARPYAERTRFAPAGAPRLVHFATSPDPATMVASLVRRLAQREQPLAARVASVARGVAERWRAARRPLRARRLARILKPWVEASG
ncbi:MAG: hypothetical protein AB1689_00910 [Thermodesulfobacteriota bacterium]